MVALLLLNVWSSSGIHEKKGSIGVISGGGYIGSRLVDYLSFDRGYSVVAFDRNPRNSSRPVVKLSAENIPTEYLQSFDTIVYLGGLVGRSPCGKQPNVTFKENVEDLVELAVRMKYDQLLLFASTSSLLTGWGGAQVAENTPLHTSEFDHYEASMAMREISLRLLSKENPLTFPRAISMRLGTVVGLSPSQRTDYLHIGLVCSAFINGLMTVTHPETFRSALWLEDLVRVVENLHEKASSLKRFDIFHVQSHWGSVGNIANAVASVTHAQVRVKEHAPAPDITGFSLDSGKLEAAINFSFKGTLDTVTKHLVDNVASICVSRNLMSPLKSENGNLSRCVVCGNTDMMPVLDLHNQPLSSDFFETKEKARACDTYPLAISRCRVCHHTQLSRFVDHARLFQDNTHFSSTRIVSNDYFIWLSSKIVAEVQAGRDFDGKTHRGGFVLDLACTDENKLDKFKKLDWKVYCVSPTEFAKGQDVEVNVLGKVEFDEPLPDTFDAIVGQNVLDHVQDPLAFLRACITVMGSRTRLYLQTSCEMYENGKFEAYHEHVSYFSAHSFFKLAALTNLTVTEFLKTNIHGVSCLVTFMRNPSGDLNEHSLTLKAEMAREVSIGLTSDFFYIRFGGLVHAMQKWINIRLSDLYQQGFEVAGLGAAASGMALMHFLQNVPDRKWELSFVVDETRALQGTFCPGTSTPVLPFSSLANRDLMKPLVMVVFSWNFAEDLLNKVADELRSTPVTSVLAIIPFPQQRLINVHVPTGVCSVVLENPAKFPIWPQTSSKPMLKTFAILTFKNVSLSPSFPFYFL